MSGGLTAEAIQVNLMREYTREAGDGGATAIFSLTEDEMEDLKAGDKRVGNHFFSSNINTLGGNINPKDRTINVTSDTADDVALILKVLNILPDQAD